MKYTDAVKRLGRLPHHLPPGTVSAASFLVAALVASAGHPSSSSAGRPCPCRPWSAAASFIVVSCHHPPRSLPPRSGVSVVGDHSPRYVLALECLGSQRRTGRRRVALRAHTHTKGHVSGGGRLHGVRDKEPRMNPAGRPCLASFFAKKKTVPDKPLHKQASARAPTFFFFFSFSQNTHTHRNYATTFCCLCCCPVPPFPVHVFQHPKIRPRSSRARRLFNRAIFPDSARRLHDRRSFQANDKQKSNQPRALGLEALVEDRRAVRNAGCSDFQKHDTSRDLYGRFELPVRDHNPFRHGKD